MTSLKDFIPKNKYDLNAVTRANEAGFPALNKIIPELLEWAQDSNWPVAQPIKSLLERAGPEIAPHFIQILDSDDHTWKYHIIDIAENFGNDVWSIVEESITRIANQPSESESVEGVNIVAQEVINNRTNVQ